MIGKKAIVAMSGGVDSSVAALILKQQGFNLIGATMKLFDNEDVGVCAKNTCCSLKDIDDARNIAYGLNIPYYVFNFSHKFKAAVIDKFIHAYENGLTPNPCIDCNRYLKFDKLLQRAKELNFDYVATGHYAQVEYNQKSGRWILKKATDPHKDQSYVLYSLTQDQLSHTLFPLGKMNKNEVRAIAKSNNFNNAKKHDSQDICFIKNGKYSDFIKSHTNKNYPPGNFVDVDGKLLGSHKGIIHYTIGQRKGLGLSFPRPMYVLKIDPQSNQITLAPNEKTYTKTLIARDINLISKENLYIKTKIKAKVRYNQQEQWAVAVQLNSNQIKVEFEKPQRAITKGQAVVLYDEDVVVGGGTICET